VREVAGPPAAPTVVLLHGLGATSAINWYASFVPLGLHYRVLALDQRGHGRGIRSHRRFRLEDCADDVIALADVLGIDRVIPVGYSMGGPVALLSWQRHADRVSGLVLCATSGFFGGNDDMATLADMFGLALRWTPPWLRRLMMRAATTVDDDATPLERLLVQEVSRHDVACLIEARSAVQRFDARRWATRVDVPTAVVATTRDRMVPVSAQMQLAQATTATVHPVPAGHEVPMTQPHLFVPPLIEACQTIVARSASVGVA
jgi:pimeloyl-ACP methyl ester carboxylesterase